MQQPQCPNWIRIILQFIGDDVGVLAVGSKVLLSVVLVHYGPTNGGVVCQCCSILESHLWQPKQSSFSIVMDTADCQWEVAEGVLGSMSFGAPSQEGSCFLKF
jgi:hypothetical protein